MSRYIKDIVVTCRHKKIHILIKYDQMLVISHCFIFRNRNCIETEL